MKKVKVEDSDKKQPAADKPINQSTHRASKVHTWHHFRLGRDSSHWLDRHDSAYRRVTCGSTVHVPGELAVPSVHAYSVSARQPDGYLIA